MSKYAWGDKERDNYYMVGHSINSLIYLYRELREWRYEDDEAEKWRKYFLQTCKYIQENNVWPGNGHIKVPTEEPPYAVSESLGASLLYLIDMELDVHSDFFKDSLTDIRQTIAEIYYRLKYNSDEVEREFMQRYKTDFLDYKDPRDGILEIDKRFQYKKDDWRTRAEDFMDDVVSSLYLNPLNIPYDCDLEEFKEYKDEILESYKEKIDYFDSNIWYEIYRELVTDRELISKIVNSHGINNLRDALLCLAELDKNYNNTSFYNVAGSIALHAECWDGNYVYSIYYYMYCLDYCKWRAGYIDIETQAMKENDERKKGNKITGEYDRRYLPPSFSIDDIFNANMGGIADRSQFWLLLAAAKARGATFKNIPDFINEAFKKFNIPLDKEECLMSTQQLLKSKGWQGINCQQTMNSFILNLRKRKEDKRRDLGIAEKLYVALCGFDWG